MTAVITASNGAGSTSPLTVTSPYEAADTSRNVFHDLIGGGLALSEVEPRPRSGTLRLLYGTEADAAACRALHRSPTTFVLTETDVPSAGMTYAVDGAVTIALDEQSLVAWVVSVDFQELIP